VHSKRLYFFGFGLILLLLIIDQAIKIWVKTNMSLGESIPILGNWFFLYFIENEGMAFGMSLGGQIGKLLLTLFRLVFSGVLIYYFIRFIKEKQSYFVITVAALIIAGALGNLIDCLFYGVIFGNYAPLFFGHVVDMFYVRLFLLPDWVPFWGGQWFFPAIFNFADSCITVGIFCILIFYPKFKELKF
jgi:signal peptidase II